MHFLTLVTSLMLYGLFTVASEFNGPSDPARFKFYPMITKGDICDADTGPDGETLWFQDITTSAIGVLNLKTGTLKEYPIPFGSDQRKRSAVSTGLRCVMRTGRDGMIYGATSTRDEIIQINPQKDPPVIRTFAPKNQNPTGKFQGFDEGWAADQGVFFSQTSKNLLTLFEYETYKFLEIRVSSPLGMRTDRHNNLWLISFHRRSFSRFNNKTEEIIEYPSCCSSSPLAAFPQAMRASTENMKYLWATSFGNPGFIRIDVKKPTFSFLTNSANPGPGPVQNDNDYCGRIWLSASTNGTLDYYTPKTGKWTTVTPPNASGPGMVIHRGPGHYMWFTDGNNGRIGRYTLDASCKGEPH